MWSRQSKFFYLFSFFNFKLHCCSPNQSRKSAIAARNPVENSSEISPTFSVPRSNLSRHAKRRNVGGMAALFVEKIPVEFAGARRNCAFDKNARRQRRLQLILWRKLTKISSLYKSFHSTIPSQLDWMQITELNVLLLIASFFLRARTMSEKMEEL